MTTKINFTKWQSEDRLPNCFFLDPERFDMIIGAITANHARFGEDIDKAMKRSFLDHNQAIAWMKEKCRELAGRADVDFIEVEPPDHLINRVLAAGASRLRQ